MQLVSTLTCPSCGQSSTETMRTNACQFFYDCPDCGTLLRPNKGDCRVRRFKNPARAEYRRAAAHHDLTSDRLKALPIFRPLMPAERAPFCRVVC